MKCAIVGLGLWVVLWEAAGAAEAAEPVSAAKPLGSAASVRNRAQIEADWLRQELVQLAAAHVPNAPGAAKITPEEDAVGGCDGVKDGKNVGYYGFHTEKQQNPWWQVDVGAALRIDRVVIYNGSTPADAKRALGLTVLLSGDAQTWKEVYRHDGSMFCGPQQPLLVKLAGAEARYVRVLLPYVDYLHLDEIEVYPVGQQRNAALHRPATQSSVSQWSQREVPAVTGEAAKYPVARIVERGRKLAERLAPLGVDVTASLAALRQVEEEFRRLPPDAAGATVQALYFRARGTVRQLALANPLLDFRDVLFVKRAPNLLLCHCDEYLSWWSRPGGELCLLEGFAADQPRLRSLTAGKLPPGDIIRPELSYDGATALFAYCRHYPDLWQKPNKLDKASIPEDAFYHLFEMRLDGTGLRRLTHGKYDDFDGRYLPNGDIVFLSTRRGQFVQCGMASAQETTAGDLPDSFVRCGGNAYRPVSVHTLHVLDGNGGRMRAISPFESFEWNPSVAADGRILYARWDYVDRHRMWHMGLWSTLPNGLGARAVFGNFTTAPYSFFEARSIPHSHKLVFTASAHHSHVGGSLVLLDPTKAVDGTEAMTRLTPEVVFPEIEGWSDSYYANPYPLSDEFYLVTWSPERLSKHAFNPDGTPVPGPINSLGVYLFDTCGNLELLHRDAAISSMCPLPVKPRPRPPVLAAPAAWEADPAVGAMLLQDIYRGDLSGFPRGSVRRLRIVGVPPKTQPNMNTPLLGVTQDDPGKFILGTVPVEADGSAYFHVPAGMPLLFQALDDQRVALQTMRSAAYVPPGQTYACVGCHDHRQTAPPARAALAAARSPSPIEPGPDGTWPLDFATLVQPVLEKHCVRCHKPGAPADGAKTNLTASAAYQTLIDYGGKTSLRQHVLDRWNERRSRAGAGAAATSPLLELLRRGHYEVLLTAGERERLITWLDTYGQLRGSFSPEQEQRLRKLREQMKPLLAAD